MQGQHGAVHTKHIGQHGTGVAPGHLPLAAGRGLDGRGVFFAVGQAHRVAVRVHQQVALSEKAGKQHTVPVLVGDLGDQVGNALGAVRLQRITQRPPVCAQVHTQLFLRLGGMNRGILGSDSHSIQGFGNTGFGLGTSLGDSGFKDAAVVAGECCGHVASLSDDVFVMTNQRSAIGLAGERLRIDAQLARLDARRPSAGALAVGHVCQGQN